MVASLKEVLEADPELSVDFIATPVAPEPVKFYKILINGEMYYDFEFAGGAATVSKAPNEAWKTPINFDTHASYFGPGPKTEMVSDLKKELKSRM